MAQPGKKTVIQENAAAFAVHNDIGEITIKKNNMLSLLQRQDPDCIPDHIIARVISQPNQRTDEPLALSPVRPIEIPVDFLDRTCLVSYFPQIDGRKWNSMGGLTARRSRNNSITVVLPQPSGPEKEIAIP